MTGVPTVFTHRVVHLTTNAMPSDGTGSRCRRARASLGWRVSMIADISLLLVRYVASDRSTYDRVGHKALRRLWSGKPREADVRCDDVTRPAAVAELPKRRSRKRLLVSMGRLRLCAKRTLALQRAAARAPKRSDARSLLADLCNTG